MAQWNDLEDWIGRQAKLSADALEKAISATRLEHRREAFGQTVRPGIGSVLASPVSAGWDPEPDYFFHWTRDAAIVMRTVAELMEDAPVARERERWRRHFEDYVRFSVALDEIDGAAFLARSAHRRKTRRGFRKFLRPDREILALSGDRLLAEPRFNPDGTPDIFRWSRPQDDGPALRALACLRYLAAGGPATDGLELLLRRDLGFTVRRAGRRCIGPWEEGGENAHHYYTAVVQLGALVHGRARARAGDAGAAWDQAEARLRAGLEQHWSERHQVYIAIRESRADAPEDLIDAAALVAVLDADLPAGPHSVQDPRVEATQAGWFGVFAHAFPINRVRPAGRAPMLGRSRGDRYFGGGAWFPTTLAAAALCYRRARCPGRGRAAEIARGDAYLAAVRAFTPPDGSLSEQVDRATGLPTSARHLTWSYAAFVTAARLRAQARS